MIRIIIVVVVMLMCAIGYVNNILNIIEWMETPGMLVMRIIGVFMVPIGIVMGYL